ncbi:MAG: MarR family transcriptional regulator [Microbacterium sp.]
MTRRIADIEYEQMLQSRHAIAQHSRGAILDRSAYLLLSRIAAEGPKSIGELSEIFRLDASTLQRQTGAAVSAGLLTRTADPEGGLAKKFSLTDAGTQQLLAHRSRSVQALDAILSSWSDAEVAAFADMLHRFNEDIERYSARRRAAV